MLPYNARADEFHLDTHHMDIFSIQDGPSDLPVFERLTGVGENDLLHPHWTAVLSVSTVQHVEASVIRLIEVYIWVCKCVVAV